MYYYYIRGLRQSLDAAEDRNIRDHLVQTIGNGDAMHEAYFTDPTQCTSRMGTRVKEDANRPTKKCTKF